MECCARGAAQDSRSGLSDATPQLANGFRSQLQLMVRSFSDRIRDAYRKQSISHDLLSAVSTLFLCAGY